ncbi:putative transcription factor Sef1p [Monosporozyma servazzii]
MNNSISDPEKDLHNNEPKRQSDISNIINHADNDHRDVKKIKLDPSSSTPSEIEMNLSNAMNTPSVKAKQSITSSQLGLNHRPVTSCTHCRQHKIKCDANLKYPGPCSRCKKFDLLCEIDAKFTPKKGSQIQIMRKDIDELKIKVKHLLANESLLVNLLKESNMGKPVLTKWRTPDPSISGLNVPTVHSGTSSYNDHKPLDHNDVGKSIDEKQSYKGEINGHLTNESNAIYSRTISPYNAGSIAESKISNLSPINDSLPPNSVPNASALPATASTIKRNNDETSGHAAVTTTLPPISSPFTGDIDNINEFIIGDVHVSLEKATLLHRTFVDEYLPYLSIMFTTSVIELYSQSKFLFWTVMLTACLSDPDPTLYIKLSSLIKQLAIETCWLRTPRSTHISQALIILSIWPLPNQKVLDDCSYRFINLAKSLSYQLGLHRGEFIYEFTRNQTLMPNAKKWRTRTWLGIFFTEICWSTILGLPPTSQNDYLVEMAKSAEEMDDKDLNQDIMNNIDDDYDNSKPYTFKLPSRFKKLISLASFQMKSCNVMGSSVISSHGLIEPKDRAGTLAALETELEVINKNLNFEADIVVQIYYLYVRLNICCFAFLPQTPMEDQSQYITKAYFYATKCVTLVSKLLEEKPLISLPIYVRQSITFSGLLLFKLQLNPLIINKYFNSARQSIVTVHRLFRNQSSAWAAVENDISRTATMLEKSNMILITHPEVFTEGVGIISRIRSHLTGSLFYDFVWCVHEARRREMDPTYHKKTKHDDKSSDNKIYPLPLYNQILKEDFQTLTETTPNGTTVTTLVPTSSALRHAEEVARTKKGDDHNTMTINGIPLTMLDKTGSVKNYDSLLLKNGFESPDSSWSSPVSSMTPFTKAASVKSDHSISNLQSDRDTQSLQQQLGMPLSPVTQSLKRMRNPRSLFSSDSQHEEHQQQQSKNLNCHRNSVPTISNTNAMSQETRVLKHQPQNNLTSQQAYINPVNSNDGIYEDIANVANGVSTRRSAINNDKRRKKDKNLNTEEALEASYLYDFFQQQSLGWTEGNLNTDDLFGWFDNVNMEPEF